MSLLFVKDKSTKSVSSCLEFLWPIQLRPRLPLRQDLSGWLGVQTRAVISYLVGLTTDPPLEPRYTHRCSSD